MLYLRESHVKNVKKGTSDLSDAPFLAALVIQQTLLLYDCICSFRNLDKP